MSDEGLAPPYPQDQTAMVQYLMSINPDLAMQIAPMMSPLTQGMLAGFAPRGDKLGTTAATNYAQDLASIGFDDAFAAYGGAGAYAEGAFDPVTTGNVVETPGRRRLLQAMQQGTSVDSIIARHLFEGGTASDAFAEINKKVQDALTAGNNATTDQQMLLAQIPPSDNPNAIPGEISSYDLSGIMGLARDMEQGAMEDPSEGPFAPVVAPDGTIISPGGERRWVDDGQGGEVLIEYSSEPSEVAQQYIDQGLSLPTDEYTPEGLLGPEWQEAAGALAGSKEVQDAASRAMRANQQDPMLAARQSEMNEIPYSGPTNNAIPSSAGGLRAPGQAGSANGPVPEMPGATSIPPPDSNADTYLDWINNNGWAGAGPRWNLDAIGNWEDVAGTDPAMRGQPGSLNRPGDQTPAGDITGQPGETPEQTYRRWIEMWPQQVMNSFGSEEDALAYIAANPGAQAPPQAAAAPAAAAPAAAAPAPAAMPDLQQLLGILGQQPGVQAAAGPDLTAAAAAQGNDVSDLNVSGYGGGFGRSRQLMPQNKMLGGQAPEPQPGTPEWWAAQGQYNVPGQAPVNPNVSGPPMPQPAAPEPDWYAYQGGYSPQGPTGTTAPALVNNTQMGPIPGSPEWLEMQGPGQFQGWPTATDALSYQNNQRHLNYPDQPEYNALAGGSANAGSLPQGGGVLGIGDYLNQYVLGGGTQPHAGPPAQPAYNPLPGNPPAPNTSARTGAEPSESAPVQQQMWFPTGAPGSPQTGPPSAPGPPPGTPTYLGPLRPNVNLLTQILGQQPTSNTSARTGAEPSEDVPRHVSAQMVQAILGQQPEASNTSRRTGAEPSESAPRGGASGAPASGALWKQLWQQAQQAGSTYDPLSSANAGSRGERYDPLSSANAGSQRDQTAGTGRSSNRELTLYNEGVGERAGKARRSAQRNLGFRQEDVDRWKAAVATNQRERSYYGAEYGRAAGLAYLMQRAGIRPLDRELAARGAVASGMGLRPS
jgi:hypothetical protein